MPDNTNMQDPKWPMPKFSFEVNLGPELQNIAFQEVNGLSAGMLSKYCFPFSEF
ncbi:hypothetical protein [uncultured Chryseobacterium sp.]|uniref:hypothetical protein n=1 Tax=uncultured Chryseobacterium sp. TaxID=259322 RepID=UPI0025E79D7B|nr:hypothetical protein [uncultured Chryseobacterium sp.]